MKKKEPVQEMTEVQKLNYFIDEMDTFLHPRVTDALKRLVNRATSEIYQKAKDVKISRELQELEPLLESFRDSILRYGSEGYGPRFLWHLRPVFKKIIELYSKPKVTCE